MTPGGQELQATSVVMPLCLMILLYAADMLEIT
jgi:hypothetical protein